MSIKIALAGNPNSGKTTLFNALTGSNQYVGNWPGVTVEKKEGNLRDDNNIILTDLPGIYSLSPYSLEEVVSRDYLLQEKPDAILNVVDGTNLERNLYLTTQLMELGIPVVIAVNMMDLVRKNGDKIDLELLSKGMGCPVVEISALKNEGIQEATEAVISAVKTRVPFRSYRFSGAVEHALAHIEEAAVHHMPETLQRWYAIKIFERDEKVLKELNLSTDVLAHMEEDIISTEKELDDDAESIIINERYEYIERLMQKCYKKKNAGKLTVSDKIDRIVTNRILALPIFVGIMWLVYTLSIGTVGDWTVNFMNDGLFGSFAETYGENTFLGSLYSIPDLFNLLFLGADGTPIIAPWLYSLIMDGIVGGIGAVLGFVPQMLILFLFLCILEDVGYMSRIAFIMDKLFRKFGLSGKSFIPLLVATGCGVPGIMASRTIEQDRDRKITIMTTGFIPCGAKMPMVGFIAGALFGGSGLIATASYFIGITAVIVSGIILKKTKAFAGNPAPFVMELPSYHAPTVTNVLRGTWERGWSFVKRAGSVIIAASIIIWTLNSLSFTGGFHYLTEGNGGTSILELLGNCLAWLFAPLGFGSWQTAVATILGLVAKEEVVGVFGSLSAMGSSIAEGNVSALEMIGAEFFSSRLAGFSFLVFNLLCAPCFAAMGAIRREMNNAKWTFFALGWMTALAYMTSLIIYQFGAWFIGCGNFFGTISAIIFTGLLGYLLFRKNPYDTMN